MKEKRKIETLALTAVGKFGSTERALKTFSAAVWQDRLLVRHVLMPFLEAAEQELRAQDQTSGADDKGQGSHVDRAQPQDGPRGHRANDEKSIQSVLRGPSSSTESSGQKSKWPLSPSRLRARLVARTVTAQTIFERCRTADGRTWASIGAHELDGMSRDGALARIVKARIGVLSSAHRFKTIPELMSAAAFEECRNKSMEIENAA